MNTKAPSAKLSILLLSLLSISLFFLIIDSTFHIKSQLTVLTSSVNVVISNDSLQALIPDITGEERSWTFDFMAEEFSGEEINIGLVNLPEGNEEWNRLGKTSLLQFDRVPENLNWSVLFPPWIDEENMELTGCPNIPMPKFEEYGEFDVIVSRVPCGNGEDNEGIRDVFRLQVNLVVANLIAKNGHEPQVYVVFIGSCGPMWEIFRCDDLLKHEGDIWIYKPDVRRLKQKVLLPIGGCQLSVPYKKQGNGDIYYDFSKVYKAIDQPREAFATVLHSTDSYVCGAIVLAQSILRTNTTKDLVLLADSSLSMENHRALETAGWKIKHIERIRSPFAEKDAYNEWNYSKLRLWELTEYDKIMFIDSDLAVLKNIDNFFELPQLSAVRNSRIVFNSGVMLIEPSDCVFETLMSKRHTLFSYNGGDQGFLNEAFTWWHRMPGSLNYFKYVNENTTNWTKLPKELYAVHFLGIKPWMCYRDYDCNWDTAEDQKFANDLFHERWWQIHDAMPKKLHGFCDLTEPMCFKLRDNREKAKKANRPDGHWKIKVKDPRQPWSACKPSRF